MFLSCINTLRCEQFRCMAKILECIQSLLCGTATPSQADWHDLYVACRDWKMTDVMRIQSTGDVNIKCRSGRYSKTPVVWAAYGWHREVLELLVNKGAAVSMVDSGGSNLSFWACLGGHVDRWWFEIIIRSDVPPYKKWSQITSGMLIALMFLLGQSIIFSVKPVSAHGRLAFESLYNQPKGWSAYCRCWYKKK